MKLIIAEKAIAGEHIAKTLSPDAKTKQISKKLPIFIFNFQGEETILIPLNGHIQNLDFPKRFSSWLGVDVRKLINSEILYINTEKEISKTLEEYAPKADYVIIATDADREGESIGLEAVNILRGKNPTLEAKRAYFSAISKEELNKAFSNLKPLDVNLADSADARREIDLVWGAVLTRFLSLISNRLGRDFISAGRVQTPTLALIVEREIKRKKFKPEKYYVLEALLEKDKTKFLAVHKEKRFKDKEKAELAKKNSECSYATVLFVKKTEKKLAKPIPFDTTTFLRAANNLGYSASRAMSIAENLYMNGYISYPRTDNQTYPQDLEFKKIIANLTKAFPEASALLKEPIKPSAGRKTQDHPPIYPVSLPPQNIGAQDWKIFELIARRFLATLADDALILSTSADLQLHKEIYQTNGLTILKPGWKAYYTYSASEETVLPKLERGDKVKVNDIALRENETLPPARYSQGSILKAMENLGLGTKATRHEIVQKLIDRGFVKGQKTLEPTPLAFALISSLKKHAAVITKPEMTSELEKEMDLIALGSKKKSETVNNSRKMLSQATEILFEHKKSIAQELMKGIRETNHIGMCPKCKTGNLRILKSKIGKRFIACDRYPECKTTFPLPQSGKIRVLPEKFCEKCQYQIIKILNGRHYFQMCINPDCETKAEWKEAIAARMEARPQQKTKQEIKAETQAEKPKPKPKKRSKAKKKKQTAR
jgi:DNA topoisomerase-1